MIIISPRSCRARRSPRLQGKSAARSGLAVGHKFRDARKSKASCYRPAGVRIYKNSKVGRKYYQPMSPSAKSLAMAVYPGSLGDENPNWDVLPNMSNSAPTGMTGLTSRNWRNKCRSARRSLNFLVGNSYVYFVPKKMEGKLVFGEKDVKDNWWAARVVDARGEYILVQCLEDNKWGWIHILDGLSKIKIVRDRVGYVIPPLYCVEKKFVGYKE